MKVEGWRLEVGHKDSDHSKYQGCGCVYVSVIVIRVVISEIRDYIFTCIFVSVKKLKIKVTVVG